MYLFQVCSNAGANEGISCRLQDSDPVSGSI